MSLNPNAISFVPKMNPNARSFVPQIPTSRLPNLLEDQQERSARNIQRRYGGNRSRNNLTLRRNRPIDYNAQRKIMNRYILDDESDDIDDVDIRIEDLKETNKLREMLRKERLASEYKKFPDRDEKLKRGQEEQRLRHRRARTKRLLRAMRNAPEDRRLDNIPTRVEGMTDLEQKKTLLDFGENYNPVLEDGSSDEDLNSDDSEDMRMKRGLREDVDYYRQQERLSIDETGPLIDYELNLADLERQLQRMKQMDPMRCKRVREMVEADPMLFRDKKFYEMYIRPCKDETTQVYLDTFFNIDWRWIRPIGVYPVVPYKQYDTTDEYRRAMAEYNRQFKRFEIEEAINKIPGKFFPKNCKIALIDCLLDLELLETMTTDYGTGPPFLRFDVLANFFRWNKSGENSRVGLKHLLFGYRGRHYSIVSRGLSGREELEMLLDLFEKTVVARNLKHDVMVDGKKRSILINDDKIEQMKRYFILMLIGVVGNPTYTEQLSELRDKMLEKYNNEFDVDPRLRESPEGLELYGKIKRLTSWIMSDERYF
jgi:hypothetical protein